MKDRKEREQNRRRAGYPASKLLAAAVSLCLCLGLLSRPFTVRASEVEPPDLTPDKKYSIRVMMVYDDNTVEGGSFEAYRVGEIVKLKNYKNMTGTSAQDVETARDTYRFWPTESLVKSMGLTQEEVDGINGIDKDAPDAESRLNAILNDKLGGNELNGIETAAQKEKLARALAAYVQEPEEKEEAVGEEERGGEEKITAGAETGNGEPRPMNTPWTAKLLRSKIRAEAWRSAYSTITARKAMNIIPRPWIANFRQKMRR